MLEKDKVIASKDAIIADKDTMIDSLTKEKLSYLNSVKVILVDCKILLQLIITDIIDDDQYEYFSSYVEDLKSAMDNSEAMVEAFEEISDFLSTYDDDRSKMGRFEGCATVVAAMKAHLDNADVARYGCLTVKILAANDDCIKEYLGSLGVCEVVVNAMNCHPNDVEVAEAGCEAISALSWMDSRNTNTLVDLDAIGTLLRAKENHASCVNADWALECLIDVYLLSLFICLSIYLYKILVNTLPDKKNWCQ